MDDWYFDCGEEGDRSDGLIEVDRVYRLDLDAFRKSDWARLDELYRSLPGWKDAPDGPCWYGTDENSPPFLCASVEPPGLQVAGTLGRAEWLTWDAAFREGAKALPLIRE